MSARGIGVSALLVGDFQTDRPLLQGVFDENRWRLFEASDRASAINCLGNQPVQVVLANGDATSWHWTEVLGDLSRFEQPPQLIVASRTADDRLWAEVLNIGGFDVLPQPLARDELERVICSARRHFDAPPRSLSYGGDAPAAGAA